MKTESEKEAEMVSKVEDALRKSFGSGDSYHSMAQVAVRRMTETDLLRLLSGKKGGE